MKMNVIYQEECLAGMAKLSDHSIDCVLSDLPYGTTNNAWDAVIPFEPLWAHYKRLLKPGGVVVLTAQAPFDKILANSNLKWLRYEWIWEKTIATGHLNANRAPLKAHENILVFCEKQPSYRPQGLVRLIHPVRRPGVRSANYGRYDRESVQRFTNYPRSVLRFPSQGRTIHPTQKPVPLFEYLIRTYTDKGQVVLDNCIGSGTTAIACLNTQRRFIGFEQDSRYFQSAINRIQVHRQQTCAPALAA